MSPEQVEALAALVSQEMDKKIGAITSKVTPQVLEKFAEGSGAAMKKHVAETRARLLDHIDQQRKLIDELRSKLAVTQHNLERRLTELEVDIGDLKERT